MGSIKNKALTPHSQLLRRNMTKEERHLWYDFLKNSPYPIHRQKVIGPYIVDFYCAAANFVIEIDGSQHYKGLEEDKIRDTYLQKQGIQVTRYSNRDIHENFRGVCEDILLKIEQGVKKASP